MEGRWRIGQRRRGHSGRPQPTPHRQSAARVAATVLTRAAVDRGSRDNVTVVVVDLSSASPEEAVAEAASAVSVGWDWGRGGGTCGCSQPVHSIGWSIEGQA